MPTSRAGPPAGSGGVVAAESARDTFPSNSLTSCDDSQSFGTSRTTAFSSVTAASVAPVAPKHARPLSQLTGDAGLAGLLTGLGTGILDGTGGGDGGDAFLKCLGSGGAKTADIVQCASKLAPTP